MTSLKPNSVFAVFAKANSDLHYLTGYVGKRYHVFDGGVDIDVNSVKVFKATRRNGRFNVAQDQPGIPLQNVVMRVGKQLQTKIILGDGSHASVIDAVELCFKQIPETVTFEALTRGRRGAHKTKIKTGRKINGKEVYRGARGGLFTESKGVRRYV